MESSKVSAGPSKHCGLDDSRTREPDLSGGRIWGKKKKLKASDCSLVRDCGSRTQWKVVGSKRCKSGRRKGQL